MSAVPKSPLTHWGRVMHICVGNLTIISSDNDLSPGWCLAIIWTNAGILLIGRIQCRNKLRWNFNQNYNIFVQENVFESVVWKTIREDRRVYMDPDYCEATHPQCVKSFEGNYSKHPCFFGASCNCQQSLFKYKTGPVVVQIFYLLFIRLRGDPRFTRNQWEKALLCKDVSRWLGANLESPLRLVLKL